MEGEHGGREECGGTESGDWCGVLPPHRGWQRGESPCAAQAAILIAFFFGSSYYYAPLSPRHSEGRGVIWDV